jgi:hypothetical protein
MNRLVKTGAGRDTLDDILGLVTQFGEMANPPVWRVVRPLGADAEFRGEAYEAFRWEIHRYVGRSLAFDSNAFETRRNRRNVAL